MQKYVTALVLILGFASVPVLYTHCGAQHQGTAQLSSTSALKPIFRDTFHPFLVSNCASCHIRGGQGNGRFASSSVDEAFDDFYFTGFRRIADMAVDANHNFPFTGPQHQEEIQSILARYTDLVSQDSSLEIPSDIFEVEAQVVTTARLLAFNDAGQRQLLWNLGYNRERLAATNTVEPELLAKLDVTTQLTQVENVSGTVGFSVASPEFHLRADAGSDLFVVGAFYERDGKIIERNMFYSLAACVRQGESAKLSDTGSFLVEDRTGSSQSLRLHILKIEKTTCSRPEELPKVSFAVRETRINEGSPPKDPVARLQWAQQAYPTVRIQVRLDKAPKQPVYVSVVRSDETRGNVQARCCDRLQPENIEVFRGLWDYHFDRADLVFYPPEPGQDPVLVQEFIVQINDDERPNDPYSDDITEGDEAEETLVLELRNLVGATSGSITKTNLVIVNDDVLSAAELGDYDANYTYEGLYKNVFTSRDASLRCIGCHNSVIRAKGYDITNYKHLISSQVVVPGQHLQSDMYRRIAMWKELGLQPMPLNTSQGGGNSGVDTSFYRVLEIWINSGAKND